MVVYVVVSKYYENDILGTFSSLVNAREGIMQVVEADENIIDCEKYSDYTYRVSTKRNGVQFFTILYDVVDYIIT